MEKETIGVIAGAGGGGCFRAGAQVQLEGGKTVAIEALNVGDEILAFDEQGQVQLAKVTKVHYHEEPQPILRVKFWRGETHITANHWVLNQYGNFMEMGRLTLHDALVDGMGHLRPIISAEVVAHEPVWNLTVEPYHTFICDGVRVHNGGHRESFPVVAGSGGGGGKGGGGHTAVEDPDSLQSRALISIIDLLGEGQIGGLVNGATSIFLNDTQVENTDGTWNFYSEASDNSGNLLPVQFNYQQRTGMQVQDPILGFSDIESPYSTGIKIARNTRYGDPGDAAASYTVTVTNPNCDQVRVVVAVSALTSADMSTGDIHGTSVQYKFQISTDAGPYVDVPAPGSSSPVLTISGKTRSRYQRQHLLTLPKPGSVWNVRMVKLTPDSQTTAVSNDLYFDSYVEIVNQRLSYPNSALVAVNFDSTQFTQLPSRSYLVDGLYIQIPSNYDPVARVYTGVWDGTFKVAVSNNPAWVLYDILANSRYGLGQFLASNCIDKAKLYQIGKYCDELVDDGFGHKEPRFVCNMVINSRDEAYKIISDLTSIFRGMSYWNGGMATFTQDAPTDPTMVFNQANVVGGVFTRQGAARKDRHSVALISWNDPAQNYKQVIEYVEDPDLVAKWGIRKVDMVSVGCTSRGQAHRAGKWILYTEKYEAETISFKVGLDAALVLPGDIIEIHDQFRAGKRMGGRIVSATTTSATLDAPVTIGALGAVFSVRLPDGTFGDVTVDQGIGTFQTLTWATPLADTPVANAIWILSESDLVPELARVLAISQDGTDITSFNIVAMAHNPEKYDAIEKGLTLEKQPTSIIDPSKVTPATNFNIVESTYLVGAGVIGSKLHLSWTGQENSYDVRYRRVGAFQSDWQRITTSSVSVDIENVLKTTYEFTLTAINGFGTRATPVTASYTVTGKTTAPGDVYGFTVTERTNDLLLSWTDVTDIDLSGYEIRTGASWDAGTVLTTNFKGTSFPTDESDAGTYNYFIRSIDSSGNYSQNVSMATIVLNAPHAVDGFDYIQSGNVLTLYWQPNMEPTLVGYEIREGATWDSAKFTALVKTTTYSMPAGATQDRMFWIKAIDSPGVYADTAAFVETAVASVSNTNVVLSSDQKALGFPGVKLFASVNNVGNLIMDDGATQSEYFFDTDLGYDVRAQNTIIAAADAVVSTSGYPTWANSNFTWDSLAAASQQWIVTGDRNNVTTEFQIAEQVGLSVNQLDGWRMNNSLYSVDNVGTSVQLGTISYQAGRYGNGVVVNDTTYLAWAVNTPAQFNYTFWITPQQVTDAIFWRVTGAGGIQLRVGYMTAGNQFFLEDNTGNQVLVPFTFAVNDRILIGVVQTATTRKLFIGNMDGTNIQYAEQTLAPLGAFTGMQLY